MDIKIFIKYVYTALGIIIVLHYDGLIILNYITQQLRLPLY